MTVPARRRWPCQRSDCRPGGSARVIPWSSALLSVTPLSTRPPGPRRAGCCSILGAKWERRFTGRCGQTRSDTVIVAASIASDVRQRRQAAGLLAW